MTETDSNPSKLKLYEIVARCPDTTPTEKAVLVAHLSHANADGTEARPGNERLSVYMDKTEDWMKRINTALVKKGWLVLVSKGYPGRASVYQVVVPAGATDPEVVLARVRAEKAADTSATGGQSTTCKNGPENQQVENPPGTGGESSLQQVVNTPPHQVQHQVHTRSTLTLDRTLTRDDTEIEETDEPKPLHETWVPNNTNRLRASRMGYDPAKLVGNFHRRVSARESRNWNRTFGYFLSCVEKGWHEVEDEFPVDPVLGHTGIVEKVTTPEDTIPVPAPVPESPEPSPVEDELPVTFQRPEWLSEREERSARYLAGHPCDDDLADALAEYLSLCESLGRAPIGSEFPTFAKTHLHR